MNGITGDQHLWAFDGCNRFEREERIIVRIFHVIFLFSNFPSSLEDLIYAYKCIKTRPYLHYNGYLAVPMSTSDGKHWGLAIVSAKGNITDRKSTRLNSSH